MDSSNVGPSLRLQLSKNCSSMGPFHSTQFFRSKMISLFPTVSLDRLDLMAHTSHLRMNSLCSSWRTAVADIPFSYRHAVSWWTRRNSLLFLIPQTWHFTFYRWGFDQRRSWSWALQHSRTPTLRLRTGCSPASCCAISSQYNQIRVQSDSNDMWFSLHKTGLEMGLSSWTKSKPSRSSSTSHS